jgi:hypothetical protein
MAASRRATASIAALRPPMRRAIRSIAAFARAARVATRIGAALRASLAPVSRTASRAV